MIYEFACQECKKRFEIKASLAEYDKGLTPNCPECKSKKTNQILSNFFTSADTKNGGNSSFDSPGPQCSSCPMEGNCGRE
jgi:putative FmdB family regulatory protein